MRGSTPKYGFTQKRLISESLALIPNDEGLSLIAENDRYASVENGRGGVGAHFPQNDILPARHEGASSPPVEEGLLPLLKDELSSMIALALPVIVTYLLEVVPGAITIVLVGRMESDDDARDDAKLRVDAAALAVMYFNVVGMSPGLGMLTALDTLYASAHGANRPSKMGQYLLTGMVLMAVTFCLVGFAMYHAADLLLFLRQPRVAREAGVFEMWLLPGLPFLYAYELLRKLSQASGQTLPMIVSAATSVLVNVVSGYFMVARGGWLGAASARSLGYASLVPTVFLGMYCSDRELLSRVCNGFRAKEAVTARAMSKFLGLGIPGMIQFMFEWIAFEAMALLCGIFPDEEEAIFAIGANAIAYQVSTLVYMLYVGASVAGSARIGNALGAGDVHRAEAASYVILFLGILLSLMNIAFIISLREKLPRIFTLDNDLIIKAKDLFLVMALYQFPDAVNCVERGIFRATGRQSLAAGLNFVAYYLIGIPLGCVFGFPYGMGVEGLWLGITIGLFFASTVNTFIIFRRCDWEQLSMEARERVSIHATTENET